MASVAITTSGMEIAMELGSIANELTIPADIRRKGKNEHRKINGWERMVNM